MRFIGDVHGGLDGHMERYVEITKGCEKSIQVGDFGFGFTPIPTLPLDHRMIRGNHDSPMLAKACANYIPDGHTENGMMFVGGAWSIDRFSSGRVDGVDWWHDEELSIGEFNKIIERYDEYRPVMMVTHDFPESITPNFRSYHSYDESRTGQALEAMLQIHRPKYWIGGHHHKNFRGTIDGTVFICLAELAFLDI